MKLQITTDDHKQYICGTHFREDVVLNAGSPMEVSSGTQDESQTSAHPCLISRLLEGAARAMQDETLAGESPPCRLFKCRKFSSNSRREVKLGRSCQLCLCLIGS